MTYFGRLLSDDLAVFADRAAQGKITQTGKPVSIFKSPSLRDFRKSGPGNRARWRAALFKDQRGRCYWCREMMVLIDRSGHKPGQPKVKYRPDEATLEHLDSRFSPERGKHNGRRRVVLAHAKCNFDRAAAEMAALPMQTIWERNRQAFLDIAKRSGALNEVEA